MPDHSSPTVKSQPQHLRRTPITPKRLAQLPSAGQISSFRPVRPDKSTPDRRRGSAPIRFSNRRCLRTRERPARSGFGAERQLRRGGLVASEMRLRFKAEFQITGRWPTRVAPEELCLTRDDIRRGWCGWWIGSLHKGGSGRRCSRHREFHLGNAGHTQVAAPRNTPWSGECPGRLSWGEIQLMRGYPPRLGAGCSHQYRVACFSPRQTVGVRVSAKSERTAAGFASAGWRSTRMSGGDGDAFRA